MSRAAKLDETSAREAVLGAADTVFYARGVAGTGMAEIRDASGVSLRRLYGLYPSKRELVAAWLTARHVTWMAWLSEAVARRQSEGASLVDAVFDPLAEWASSPGYRGCGFLNTAAEAAEIGEPHRRIIADHKRALIAYLAQLAAAAGHRQPELLARELGVLIDGAIVQAAVLSSLDPIDAARAAAVRLLDASRSEAARSATG